MTESERQSTSTHPNNSQESSKESLHFAKKKHIKKDSHSANHILPKLSKEERSKLQKQKNREAAQRSRDQHKEYVSRLQNEVRQLKAQVECNRRYCFKCQQELDSSHFAEDEKSDEMLDIQMFPQVYLPAQPICKDDGEMPVDDVADYFLRTKEEPEQDSSYIKMMLFVAVTVIAILLCSSTNGGRTLVESSQPFQSLSAAHPIDSTGKDIQQMRAIAPYSFDKRCLEQLISFGQPGFSNLRVTDRAFSQGGLICTFQRLSNTWNYSQGKEALIRLLLIGSEIKQLAMSHSKIGELASEGLQLNGIYELSADVRSVKLISRHNCLL